MRVVKAERCEPCVFFGNRLSLKHRAGRPFSIRNVGGRMFLSACCVELIYMRVFTRERGNEGNLPVCGGENKPTDKATLMSESRILITDECKHGCKFLLFFFLSFRLLSFPRNVSFNFLKSSFIPSLFSVPPSLPPPF